MSSTLNTIPASLYVGVTPSVIGTGGTGIDLIELMLTKNTRVPIGAVLAFPNEASVTNFFGSGSLEAVSGGVYFAGPSGASVTPDSLLFVQYPTTSVGAYMRGGNVSALALSQLQAINGTLDFVIDGVAQNGSVNLSAATNFAVASEIISNAYAATGPTHATTTAQTGATFTGNGSGTNLTVSGITGIIHPGTATTALLLSGSGIPTNTYIVSQTSGTPGGNGVYVTNNATTASSASCTCTSNILDVTAVASGAIQIGDKPIAAGYGEYYVVAQLTGTIGAAGEYQLSAVSGQFGTAAFTFAAPLVSYDSLSGAFVVVSGTTGASSSMAFATGTAAAALGFTQATGAVLSQGAIAAVPGSFMDAIVAQTINWATFQTLFDPDAGSGNAQKQLFAAWTNAQNNRYAYLAWDNDITPTESNAATSSLGYILDQLNSSGTMPIYEVAGTNSHLAPFLGGYAASIDFNATNGRATAAYKSQAGIIPTATSALVATNLGANGYNYYGAVATAGANWNFLYPGSITGPYKWLDSFLNQIWFNNQLQIALLNYLTVVKRIPYNPPGYAAIRQVLSAGANQQSVSLPPASPIAAALNNGVITPGVDLSSAEQQAVLAEVGLSPSQQTPILQTLASQGWYLLIQPASAAVRGARQSPTIILFYTDGGSIQVINLSSVLVQ